jgi:hypothetical protein
LLVVFHKCSPGVFGMSVISGYRYVTARAGRTRMEKE